MSPLRECVPLSCALHHSQDMKSKTIWELAFNSDSLLDNLRFSLAIRRPSIWILVKHFKTGLIFWV